MAISNHRMLFVGNGVVRFAYGDYADHDRMQAADSSAKLCPNCGGPLRIIEILPATRCDPLAPAAVAPDTS